MVYATKNKKYKGENFMKRVTSTILVCLLVICSLNLNNVQAASKDNINEVDEFLLKTGMPLDTVKDLDKQLKRYIYETTDSTEKLTFSEHTEKLITLPNQNINNDGIDTCYIPQEELALTVIGFRESDGMYKIYPSFEWKESTKIGNDTFAIALPEGWRLEPESYNLRVWGKLNPWDMWQVQEDFRRPSCANFYGYEWRIPSSWSGKGYARGNAYFYATPTTSKPDKRICISYADDITHSLKASYSLSYKALSISISRASDEQVRFGSEILGF